MTEIPTDLIPLPTMPYDQRPVGQPLDVEECRTAIWLCRGNVSKAAERIKVPASRLRNFIKGSPRLTEEVQEAREQLVDLSEDIAYEALVDTEDSGRRDQMARFIMSNIGKDRGYGTGGGGNINLSLPKGPISISWADGSTLSASGSEDTVIDHE